MNAQHAQRKPRYGLYSGLLAAGIAAALGLYALPFIWAATVLGGLS